MKKYIVWIILILVLFSFTACDPNTYYFDYEELNTNVEKIELIYYENESAKELFNKRDKVLPFDFKNMEILEKLSSEKYSEFLQEFIQIGHLETWRHLDSPKYEGIKITYNDGSFDIICSSEIFSCRYYDNGEVKQFIGTGGGIYLVELVNKYFQTKIEYRYELP